MSIKESKDFIRKCLREAFDEGVESPYDLKDAIVDNLFAKVISTVTIQQLFLPPPYDLIINHFNKHLHPTVLEFLSTGHCFLCGGAIVRILLGHYRQKFISWTESDHDLFIHNNNIEKLKQLQILGKYKFVQSKSYKKSNISQKISSIWTVAKLKPTDPNIHLIAGNFSTINDVLNDFDFIFLQSGLYYNEGKLKYKILNEQVWHDLTHNLIRLTPTGNMTCRSWTFNRDSILLKRIRKYIKRGFRDCTGLYETGLLPNITRGLNPPIGISPPHISNG